MFELKSFNRGGSLKATTVAAMLLLPSLAAAQSACESYTVKDGDSLAQIAFSAYGSYDYQIIFNANRNSLSGNPNDLDPGLTLQIPCEDGRLTADAKFLEVVEEQEKIAAAKPKNKTYEPDIKVLLASGWAPYTDESLSGGGFLTRLATTALNRAGNDRPYELGWVNDDSSHLTTLMPLGAFDIAVAWTVPDCDKNPDLMGEDSQRRCYDFYHTVPLYESIIGYYTRPDSKYADAKTLADFSGAKFCRMKGYFTNDLEEAGLVEPLITLVRPTGADECIKAVADGTADVTGMAVQQALGAIAATGLEAEVDDTSVTYLTTIRILAHKSNPFALQYVAMLDAGLNEMRETGEWYDIVSSTLAEYNEKIATN
ncbi:MAG: LysM peptidoglycan-binding domain-containing protein [Albidovulum sp.]|uniref:LysM peptidoglycan-binding domain-containing protein n=1 Tax=Albidovulum sp. TaxID=1872424 RepID=UPI003CB5C037